MIDLEVAKYIISIQTLVILILLVAITMYRKKQNRYDDRITKLEDEFKKLKF